MLEARHLQSHTNGQQSEPPDTGKRLMEHRKKVLRALGDALDLKTVVYIQTIVLLDLRDLLLSVQGILAITSEIPMDEMPEMEPTPGTHPQDQWGMVSPAAPPPAYQQQPPFPAFGPPYQPPVPPGHVPGFGPAYQGGPASPFTQQPPAPISQADAALQQLAQIYSPDVLYQFLTGQAALPAPFAPAPQAPEAQAPPQAPTAPAPPQAPTAPAAAAPRARRRPGKART